jgi:hypothetical protein
MDRIEKARELGYVVEEAFDNADSGKVYRVKGFGIDTMYSEKTNEDEWKFLIDPKAHEHRVNMFKHNKPSVEEAVAAGLSEADGDDFTMTDEEIQKSAIEASLSVGLIDEEQAEEMLTRTKEVISS